MVFQVSCAEWPGWFRDGDYGWVPLAVIPSPVVDNCVGKLSGVWKQLLHMLFTAEPFNLSSGFALPSSSRPGSPKRLFKARVGFIIQDEASLKQTLAAKGASGSSPCIHCSNMYKGIDTRAPTRAGQPNVKHIALAFPADFEPRTNQSIWDCVDYLSDQEGRVPKYKFAELQQCLGWVSGKYVGVAMFFFKRRHQGGTRNRAAIFGAPDCVAFQPRPSEKHRQAPLFARYSPQASVTSRAGCCRIVL